MMNKFSHSALMSRYGNSFKENNYMSLLIKDDELLENIMKLGTKSAILWENHLIAKRCTKKNLKTGRKSHGDKINSDFHDKKYQKKVLIKFVGVNKERPDTSPKTYKFLLMMTNLSLILTLNNILK